MCLHPHPIDPIPDETARVARAAFPQGSFAMQVRDLLGSLYEDGAFASLYPARGKPAAAPWRLMLVTVFQYVENLTDRQAAEAVAARIDWKYALSLPLEAPGFNFSVLSEFRDRLVTGDVAALVLDPVLARCRDLGLLRAGGQQRTDSTHVVAAVRTLNRLEVVAETMRMLLNALAAIDPAWIRALCPPSWGDRYGPRVQATRLAKTAQEREHLVTEIGREGAPLLRLLDAPTTPTVLAQHPAVAILRTVWHQQYAALPDGTLRWRHDAEMGAAADLIQSPHDLDARYASKRDMHWTGTSVHLTETCGDPERPNLVIRVGDTPASTQDQEQTEIIHADLRAQNLSPCQHLVDGKYVDAAILARAHRQGIDLVTRVPVNQQWQARAGTGFAGEDFAIDWGQEQMICPAGQRSSSWRTGMDRQGTPIIKVGFARRVCGSCALKEQCTQATHRVLTIHPKEAQEALGAARRRQQTAAFKQLYALRSGVESTISQAVTVCGLRSARYRGLAKTHLQHLATVVAQNLMRIIAWLARPEHPETRPSPFQRAMAPV